MSQIEELAKWPEIRVIRKPIRPSVNDITSGGVGVIGASAWHSNELRGNGVKVGIIDFGFENYSSLLGTELPASVTTKVFGSEADFACNYHGTACAEIIYDVAPEASVFLVNVADMAVGFHNAVLWLQPQGVDVISSSIAINLLYYCKLIYELLDPFSDESYILEQVSYLDEITQQWDSTINNVVSEGITWSQAAGNYARQQWTGCFNDSDGDYYLNFASDENYNEIKLPPNFEYGHEVYVLMIWGLDTGASTRDDYNLDIIDEFGYEVASSTIEQSLLPVGIESCKFTPFHGKRYYVRVFQWWASPQEINLVLGVDDFAGFKHPTPAQTVSVSPPADNPNVITVGAVPWWNPDTIEPYSSQGPTNDGVIKPDLVAPDKVSTASYGSNPFGGTSAAAPHVAGACALVKQAYPTWSPSQIKSFLESNAIDLGTPGKDNTYGSGLVSLSAIVPPTVSPPNVCTAAPTSVTSNSATLDGTVNPNGADTACHFEYGTTTGYGSTAATSGAGSGTSDVSVSADITGLTFNTTYHFRLVAENRAGTTYGSDQSFTTSGGGEGDGGGGGGCFIGTAVNSLGW